MGNKRLTPEQMEKARACKSMDDLLVLSESEGIELTDEQLKAVSGGAWCSDHELGCQGDGCDNYHSF